MLKVFFPDEIKQIEALMMERHCLSSSDLVMNAVDNLCQYLTKENQIKKEELTTVIIGPGNNGEDGLGLAKELIRHGYFVKILSCGRNDFFGSISYEQEPVQFRQIVLESKVMIDALFGIGLNRNVAGHFKDVIELMNQSKAFIYSIDIPSGLHALSGLVLGSAVIASKTLVIGAYKSGLLMNQGMDYSGVTELIPVAIDYDLIKNQKYIYDQHVVIRKRPHFSNKYDYGNVLTVGGSLGYFGAPTLTAISSLRLGSGLSRIALRKEDYPYYTQSYPELVIERYENLDEFISLSNKMSAFAFGPGIKKDDLSKEVLHYLLSLDKPLIVDASGIELLETLYDHEQKIIITPHLGELVRLTGLKKEELLKNPFPVLKDLSKNGFITLLKGPTTVVELGDITYFLPYGSPGMATAGMGDILTGMILSFLGKGYTLEDSVLHGAMIHIKSSLLAISERGEESFISSDALNYVGEAFKKVGTYET